MPYDLSFYGIFGGIIFANRGGGVWRNDLQHCASFLLTGALKTHTPLIKGVEFHPLNSLIKGAGCQKPLVLKCFLGPTPLIKGVQFAPP